MVIVIWDTNLGSKWGWEIVDMVQEIFYMELLRIQCGQRWQLRASLEEEAREGR